MLGRLLGFLGGAAKSGIGKRALLGAGYVGAGQLGSAAISAHARGQRAYLGDREFDRRYSTYHENVASTSRWAGYILGGAALFGRDPISGTRGRLGKFATRRAAKRELRGVRGEGFTMYPSSSRQELLKSEIKKNNPYTGLMQRVAIGAAATGYLGYQLSGQAAALWISLPAAGLLSYGTALFNRRLRGPLLLGGAAAGAGAAVGTQRPLYPAGESGNISVAHNKQSTVARMNFNTAGLSQALHSNRRSDS